MGKFVKSDIQGAVYSVTLYGLSDMVEEERVRLSKVFCEVMEAILGSAQQVIEVQYDYNRIADKYCGTSLPITATGDEKGLVLRWENAYQASFDAAFVSVFGDLSLIPDEAHFEIKEETDLTNESGSDRNKTEAVTRWPDADAGG